VAGYKLFFVSAQGKFWICSMVHTEKSIMDITLDDLYANYRKKSCQKGCGVYCAVSTSLVVQQPVRVLGSEIMSRARRIAMAAGRSLMPRLGKARSGALVDPEKAQQMNGHSDPRPSADQDINTRKAA
jgi:hypothetical protein